MVNRCKTDFPVDHQDEALASIKLARAATNDSSSMKAIAIMTMAFLPGTFFAALFSVLSLRWDADPRRPGELLGILGVYTPIHGFGVCSLDTTHKTGLACAVP